MGNREFSNKFLIFFKLIYIIYTFKFKFDKLKQFLKSFTITFNVLTNFSKKLLEGLYNC